MLRDVLQIGNRNGIPFTYTVIALSIIGWMLNYFLHNTLIISLGFFTGGAWWLHPWTMLTWPLVSSGNPLYLLLNAWFTWQVLGSLERSWGIRNVAGFFFGCAALLALGTGIGTLIFKQATMISTLYIAMVAPVVAFCMLNRQVRFSFFVVSVPAPLLAGISVVMLWWVIGNPFIGLCALVAPAFAYWYVTGGQQIIGGLSGGISRGTKPRLTLLDLDKDKSKGESSSNLSRQKEQKNRQDQEREFEAMMRRSYAPDNKSDKDEKDN